MAEKILWAQKAAGMRRRVAKRYDLSTKKMETVIDEETGEPVYEKIPQRGHAGDPLSAMDPNQKPLPMARWSHLLKHCGTEARIPITNAAAQTDPDTKYRQYMNAKTTHFGWIPVGACPVVMLMTGDIRPSLLADPVLKKQNDLGKNDKKLKACEHGTYGEQRPCPHYLDERTARRERTKRKQDKRNNTFRQDVDKTIDAQREQTIEIAKIMAAAIAEGKKG